MTFEEDMRRLEEINARLKDPGTTLEKAVELYEEGIAKGCGVATLSISYYDLGYTTGEMAYDILVNGTDIKTMEVKSAPKFTKEYLPDRAKELGITVPDGYEEISAE